MAKNYPEVIPKTYAEMERYYGRYIVSLLLRHNKVERHQRELYQDVWQRLLQAGFLERYWEKVENSLPTTMLRDQACEVLGVTVEQWHYAMQRFHTQGKGHWMPLPINMPEFEAQGRRGLYSAEALYDTDDILKLADESADDEGRAVPAFPGRGAIDLPQLNVTPAHFRNYLARAIFRHFANFCRTKARRDKERLGDTFSEFRGLPGREDDSQPWDQRLTTMNSAPALYSKEERDEHKRRRDAGEVIHFMPVRSSSFEVPAESHEETVAVLREVTQRLKTVLHRGMDGVASCKPVEQHEAEMFEGLMAGKSLPQVVKGMDIPRHVKRAVLRSVEHSA